MIISLSKGIVDYTEYCLKSLPSSYCSMSLNLDHGVDTFAGLCNGWEVVVCAAASLKEFLVLNFLELSDSKLKT